MNRLSRFGLVGGTALAAILLAPDVTGVGVAPTFAQIDAGIGIGASVGEGGGIDPHGPGVGPSRSIDPSETVGVHRGIDTNGGIGGGVNAGVNRNSARRRAAEGGQFVAPGTTMDSNGSIDSSIDGDLGTTGGVGTDLNGR